MTLPATTYGLALGHRTCAYCVEGVVVDEGPAICSSCWDRLYDDGRIAEFHDRHEDTRRVFVDGKEVDL